MKITITGRHIDVSDELRKYAEKKLTKLEKYFHRPIDIQVTMYMEKHIHVIEAVINADSNRIHGIEQADDMYYSIDLLAKSMEKQAVKHKGKHTGHKAVSKGMAEAGTAEKSQAKTERRSATRIRPVSGKPKDEIEAFLEMKVENLDFMLFKKFKKTRKLELNEEKYALIFKNKGGFRMAEIPINLIKEKKPYKKLVEFEIIIKNDSITNPEIKFKKSRDKKIENLTLDTAMDAFKSCRENFLPFFNGESNILNIIFKSGNEIEILSPEK